MSKKRVVFCMGVARYFEAPMEELNLVQGEEAPRSYITKPGHEEEWRVILYNVEQEQRFKNKGHAWARLVNLLAGRATVDEQ